MFVSDKSSSKWSYYITDIKTVWNKKRCWVEIGTDETYYVKSFKQKIPEERLREMNECNYDVLVGNLGHKQFNVLLNVTNTYIGCMYTSVNLVVNSWINMSWNIFQHMCLQ